MATASTHFKLGIFTLIAIVAGIAMAFGLGARATTSETVRFDTYFDESVEGLEIGSPVKYRGVKIGSVSAIEIAPDHQKVDVGLALAAVDVRRLGLETIPPELRTQLGTQGITGVKYVDIDFFDPKANPPPVLPFEPPARYIPAAPSVIKGLTEDLGAMLQRLPAVADATTAVLQRIDRILEDFEGQRLPARFEKAVEDIDGAAGDIRVLLRHIDKAHIPDKTASAMDGLSTALAKVNVMMDRIGGDGGLVASTQRATDRLGDLGRNASGSAGDLQKTLRDLDEAAQAIRDLAQELERDPEMLVKGRPSGGGR